MRNRRIVDEAGPSPNDFKHLVAAKVQRRAYNASFIPSRGPPFTRLSESVLLDDSDSDSDYNNRPMPQYNSNSQYNSNPQRNNSNSQCNINRPEPVALARDVLDRFMEVVDRGALHNITVDESDHGYDSTVLDWPDHRALSVDSDGGLVV